MGANHQDPGFPAAAARQSPRSSQASRATSAAGSFRSGKSRSSVSPIVPQAFQSGGPGTSSGPGGPNLVGAVIYLPLGGETTERPFVGGVGTPEMRERFRESTYEIAVRLDDGSLRFVQRHDGTRYRVGDRVRLSGVNQIELVSE